MPPSQRRATNLARTRSGSVKVKARAPLPRPIRSRMRGEHKFGCPWTPNAYSPMSNFTRLDPGRLEIAILVDAMLRAREVVTARPWSTSQEATSEHWWADVLADPRARWRQARGFYGRDGRRTAQKSHYRLADEPSPLIEVSCSKCEWKGAFSRAELLAMYGAECPLPTLLNHLAKSGHRSRST